MTPQRFRKKPVVIEAFQLRESIWNELCEWIGQFPDGMRGVYVSPDGTYSSYQTRDSEWGLLIPTLEGTMLGRKSDWIIKGVKGEYYPCRDDIFRQTYEAVVGDA